MQTPSPPASPRLPPIVLVECIEETLRYVLSSFKDDKLGTTELGLSKQYCSELLRDEGDNHILRKNAVDTYGVPSYPLYKRVASTLYRCITSGTSLKVSHTIESIKEIELIKQQENDWNRLISEKGLALALNAVEFELHVQEPFFTQLRDGLKTVEGRCAVGNYNRYEISQRNDGQIGYRFGKLYQKDEKKNLLELIAPGDLLLFNKCLLLEVQCVKRYSSFSEMLKREGLSKILPGIETIEEGVQIYRNFYTEEKEKLNGVLGISVLRPVDQPYIHVTSILSSKKRKENTGCYVVYKLDNSPPFGEPWADLNTWDHELEFVKNIKYVIKDMAEPPSLCCSCDVIVEGLGYSGIGSTLGLVQSTRTVLDALPPSRSALSSSIISHHQQNVNSEVFK